MRPHWSDKLKKKIAELERKCDIFSAATRQANEENKQLREAFRAEQAQRIKAEKKAHDLKLENIRLNLENKQLQSEFIDQRSLQDALYKSSKKLKKLEKQLNVRSGKEEPYGLNTPSSKRIYKSNSNEENRAKKGGAKVGHAGHGRTGFSEAEVDRIVYIEPDGETCKCGGKFAAGQKVQHSVYKYIPARLEKRIYYKYKLSCLTCGMKVLPGTPNVMPGYLYGNDLIAHILTEIFYHGQTFGKMSKRFDIGIGSICNFAHHCALLLKPLIELIIARLRTSKLIHADETTWSCDGRKGYAWFFGNSHTRLYIFRQTRGSEIPITVIGRKKLMLVLITDRYGGYTKDLKVLRQYCYAHLLRDVIGEMEDFPDEEEVQKFGSDLSSLLKKAMQLRNKNYNKQKYLQKADKLKGKIVDLCNESAQHPAVQHLQNIFRENKERMYQWAKDPDIPADNNFAEREHRKVVINRKISFGSQAEQGLATREVLMSVMHTVAAEGCNPEKFIKKALDLLAKDKNLDPSLLFKLAKA
jgi:transposase